MKGSYHRKGKLLVGSATDIHPWGAYVIFHRLLPVLALASLAAIVGDVRQAHAQPQGVPVPSSTTIGILLLLSLVATLLIAARFKWIQVSVSPRVGWPTRVPPRPAQVESTVDLSEELLAGVRSGLESSKDVLVREKEALLTERDRLRELRGEARQDTQGYFDVMAELKRSKAQVEQVTVELGKLQERFRVAQEENERIRSELMGQRSEVEQVRAKLTAERAQVERLRLDLERERGEVEKALAEVAKEWELLRLREEEIDRARKELFDFVAALTKSREELSAELQAAATLWSGRPERGVSG